MPSSSPTYHKESWGEIVTDKTRRFRHKGMCENDCSGHGSCEENRNCVCFNDASGAPAWIGADCSLRTCPVDVAWVGNVVGANNLSPSAECSGKGRCNRKNGECSCFNGYEGIACQRQSCPENCNHNGLCWPQLFLAERADRVYEVPWDAMKAVGCVCDTGFRGPSCALRECPSGADPSEGGYGNEAGRDCSGRGICDYATGLCDCFSGFYGLWCQHKQLVFG
jgi:hypothetical protein